MLSVSLIKFNAAIKELRSYIGTNSLIENYSINSQTKEDPDTKEFGKEILIKKNTRKLYEYNAHIISLYGYLERFIEDIVYEYLNVLCRLSPLFSSLSSKIQDNNFKKSIELINKLSYPKYSHLSNNLVIENIHNSINQNISSLNKEAFVHNGGNYRHSVISECFVDIGIDNYGDIIKKINPIKDELILKYGDKYISLEDDTLFYTLNDLVQRRNDIAHGTGRYNIISSDIFEDYISFIEKYCISIVEMLIGELYKMQYENNENEEIIPKDIFKKKILCADFTNFCICKGDYLICKKGEGNIPQYINIQVENIQVADENFEEYLDYGTIELGLLLSKEINKNCKFKQFI